MSFEDLIEKNTKFSLLLLYSIILQIPADWSTYRDTKHVFSGMEGKLHSQFWVQRLLNVTYSIAVWRQCKKLPTGNKSPVQEMCRSLNVLQNISMSVLFNTKLQRRLPLKKLKLILRGPCWDRRAVSLCYCLISSSSATWTYSSYLLSESPSPLIRLESNRGRQISFSSKIQKQECILGQL